ncbi:MAG: Gfo/Idh/MocA family oxidoreductase [Bacteroidota bacterium]
MQNEKMKRRSFVKASSMMASGTLLMPSMLAAKAHIDGSDAIKIGLIGCGGRGTGAIVQALQSGQNVELVAMADAFKDRLEGCYNKITDPEFKDWSSDEPVNIRPRIKVTEEHKFVGFDAYQKVIPLVDVVILATPPGFRPMHFEAAINADKHVFMEKPLAVDAPGIRKVLEVAEMAKKKKLNVVVGLQRHYQKIYQEWVDMLQNGVIGDITSAQVYWNSGGVWVRDRKNLEEQAGRSISEMEYQMRNWYYFNWLCGDHINEQHIHNIDVGNWVKQAYPVRAHGMGGRLVRNGKDHGEIFDHHFLEFEYEDGSRMFSQCRHIPNTKYRVSEAFTGTNGSAPEPGVIKTKSGYRIMKYNDKKDKNPYQHEHDVLFKAIAKGEYKFADAENGAKSTMTALMGRMATYSGQVIEWDAALNSNISLMPEKFAFNAPPPILPNAEGYYPVAVPGETKVI